MFGLLALLLQSAQLLLLLLFVSLPAPPRLLRAIQRIAELLWISQLL